ncbi:unnamed protein product [Darwinula stevensoni]|uniref:Uncharacterized protein n=1 Tax=Darwinula stevensoni TaxID=69355 RepID=A0A7R8XDC4_9CRUS|nr:unnamed protein product [Darwinula stevensoni]CAG0888498.1 unnamed protein product [Darwinula stevensoni]
MSIDRPALSLPRKAFMNGFDDEDVQVYYEDMVKWANLLGADPERARQELKETVEFEIFLYNNSLPDEDRRNETELDKKMTISELENRWPIIPWFRYIDEMLSPFHNVTPEEPVIIAIPSYIDQLSSALKVTPKRLADVLAAMYVRSFFTEGVRNDVIEMVGNIHAEFDVILDEADWMDDTTRSRAKLKSSLIKPIVGYPEELMDDDILTERYDGLHLVSDHYDQNIRNLNWFLVENYLRLLKEERYESLDVLDANAYYSADHNTISTTTTLAFHSVNGNATLDENIASNGGFKVAYRAYVKWNERNGEEKSLPGLERLTSRQMFWISAAQAFCSKDGNEAMRELMNLFKDQHAPMEFQIRGGFQNMPEFARDFKCALGTPYNPEERCTVW